MKAAKRAAERGFTLVELAMAVAVGLVILAAILSAVVAGQRSASGIERRVTTGQDARIALEIMGAEIRMASYNPLYAAGLWVTPPIAARRRAGPAGNPGGNGHAIPSRWT